MAKDSHTGHRRDMQASKIISFQFQLSDAEIMVPMQNYNSYFEYCNSANCVPVRKRNSTISEIISGDVS